MHPRYVHPLFTLILSGVMTLLVSGIATVRSVGVTPEVPGLWMSAWATSWVIAFPLLFVLAPAVRRFVQGLVRA